MRLNSFAEINKRFWLVMAGVILGWMIAHHFVIVQGGAWPDKSILGYMLRVWEIPGLGAGIGILISLFSRRKKRRDE
jgi:hypothetical protein